MVHGRGVTLVGGVDRDEKNIYIDAVLREQQKKLQEDELFAEMNENWDMVEEPPKPVIPTSNTSNKNHRKNKSTQRRRGIAKIWFTFWDWWNKEPEISPEEEERLKQKKLAEEEEK